MRARLILFMALLLVAPASVLGEKTLKFAVIGDSGTGGNHQKLIAGQMLAFHRNHSWKFILMLGDNVYEDGDPKHFDKQVQRHLQGNSRSHFMRPSATTIGGRPGAGYKSRMMRSATWGNRTSMSFMRGSKSTESDWHALSV